MMSFVLLIIRSETKDIAAKEKLDYLISLVQMFTHGGCTCVQQDIGSTQDHDMKSNPTLYNVYHGTNIPMCTMLHMYNMSLNGHLWMQLYPPTGVSMWRGLQP